MSGPANDWARRKLAEDDLIITWAWSQTEIVRAVERRAREGLLSRSQRREVLGRLDTFADHRDETGDIVAVRRRANVLPGRPARGALRPIPGPPPQA